MNNLTLKMCVCAQNFIRDQKKFVKSKKGQGSVEYALIIALVVMVIIGIILAFGNKIANKLNSIDLGT